MTRVLITGATGFLGRHVLAALRALHPDWQTVALVRDRSEWSKLDWTAELGPVELVEGGITGPKAWQDDPRLDGITAIVHLAAVVRHSRHAPADMYEANVDGTLRLVRLAAKRNARMVYVSTSGTVGCFKSAAQTADEDAPYVDRTVARWPYYDSKIQAERRARALAGELQVIGSDLSAAFGTARPPADSPAAKPPGGLLREDAFRNPEHVQKTIYHQGELNQKLVTYINSDSSANGRIGAFGVTTRHDDERELVLVESVTRFKGLERDVIVLVRIEPVDYCAFDPMLYVGASRARAQLVVIGAPELIARFQGTERPVTA